MSLARLCVVLALLSPVGAVAQADLVDQGYAALGDSNTLLAQDLARQALTASQDDASRFRAFSLLADVYAETDDLSEAVSAADNADALAVRLFGDVHAERLVTLERVGVLRAATGQRTEAVRAFAAMQRISRAVDDDPVTRLGDTLNLGWVMIEAGAPADASVFASDALWMSEDVVGVYSAQYTEAAVLRATAQLALGHPVEGLVALLPVLERDLSAFLADFPDVAPLVEDLFASYDTAAAQVGEIGPVQDAWLAQAQRLAAARTAFPWDTIADVIVPAFAAGDLATADRAARRAFARVLQDDPRPAQVYLGLAQAHLSRGDPASAAPWVDRLMRYPTAFLAGLLDDPAGLTDPVADALIAAGRPEEGLALADRALQVARLAQGDASRDVLYAQLVQADRLATQGQAEDARALVARVKGSDRATGDAHLTVWRLFEEGQLAGEAGDTDTAATLFSSALLTFESTGLRPDALYAALLRQAAEMETRAGRTLAGIALAQRAVAAHTAQFGPDARETALAQVSLVTALVAGGQNAQAVRTYQDLRHTMQDKLKPGDALWQTVLLAGLNAGDASRSDEIAEILLAETDAMPPTLRASLYLTAADLSYQAGRRDLSARLLSRAETGFAADPPPALFALRARLALDDGRIADALDDFRRIDVGTVGSGAALPDVLPYYLQAVHIALNEAAPAAHAPLLDEAFGLVQRINTTVAGESLGHAAKRWQVSGELAMILRDLQDAEAEAAALRIRLAEALAEGADVTPLREALETVSGLWQSRQSMLAQKFPDFAAYSASDPVSLRALQDVLEPEEAVLVIASTDLVTPAGESVSQATLVRADRVVVAGLPTRADLRAYADALRCQAALTDPRCTLVRQSGTRGGFVLDAEPTSSAAGFDHALAYAGYDTLLGRLDPDLTGVSTLVFVPDAASAALPLHLLQTQAVAPDTPMEQAPWLLRDMAAAVVPSVASFLALRRDAVTAGRTARFLGVGDPLIGAQQGGALPYPCDTAEPVLAMTAPLAGDMLRGADATERLRGLSALPETRCELAGIASRFGNNSRVLLQGEATETALRSTDLTGYTVIGFATHGLIAGEVGNGEAGLVLTPPAAVTGPDDGLLTTTEVASLRLDADFVVLSACNTASGQSDDDEALSGLASAFFYAGARSLLVSHWPVYSDAAVSLTTGLFDLRAADQSLGRAQALRQTMLTLLDDPNADDRQRHPAFWSPFVLIGAE